MSSRRAAGLVAVLFAVLCVLWLLSARGGDPEFETASPATVHPGMTGSDPGVPPAGAGVPGVGSLRSQRSEEGARAVAVADVLSGRTLLALEPTRVAAAVRDVTAAEVADDRAVKLGRELDALRDRVAHGTGEINYVQAPLAVRVGSFSPDRAQVLVWWVGVLWRRDGAEPQAGWATTTVDLVWEAEAWKVWSEATTSGPTPLPNADPPVSARQLDLALAGFDAWRAQR